MNQQASQSGARVDLRQTMPETAKWVEAKRKEYGAEFVNGCIRRALRGEPGLFYAIERGHVLGTPFPFTNIRHQYQNLAVITGCSYAGFLAEPPTPPGATHETT